jgi:hypothetical protein
LGEKKSLTFGDEAFISNIIAESWQMKKVNVFDAQNP